MTPYLLDTFIPATFIIAADQNTRTVPKSYSPVAVNAKSQRKWGLFLGGMCIQFPFNETAHQAILVRMYTTAQSAKFLIGCRKGDKSTKDPRNAACKAILVQRERR